MDTAESALLTTNRTDAKKFVDDPNYLEAQAALAELAKRYHEIPFAEDGPSRTNGGIDFYLSRNTYFDLLLSGAVPLHHARPSQLLGKRMLDIGTGLGFWVLEPLVYFGVDVTGIDLSFHLPLEKKISNQLSIWLPSLNSFHDPTRKIFYVMDALEPSQVASLCETGSSGCFDIVTSHSSVFMHLGFHAYQAQAESWFFRCFRRLSDEPSLSQLLENLDNAFAGAFAVLKPGGQLWLSRNQVGEAALLIDAAKKRGFELVAQDTEYANRQSVANALQTVTNSSVFSTEAKQYYKHHYLSGEPSSLSSMTESPEGDVKFDAFLLELLKNWSGETNGFPFFKEFVEAGDNRHVHLTFRKP